MDRRFMFMKKNVPCPGAMYMHVHAYDHNSQTSSRKRLSQSKPNFIWNIVRKGE